MKNAVIFAALAVLALSNLSMWTAIYNLESGEHEEPELAALMGDMQRYLHKLDLSVQAGSSELVGFYAHELEELSETIIEEVPTYEAHEIAALTRQMLLPQIEALESAVHADGDIVAGLKNLTASCNGCHAATDHDYVRVTPADTNPFNPQTRILLTRISRHRHRPDDRHGLDVVLPIARAAVANVDNAASQQQDPSMGKESRLKPLPQ